MQSAALITGINSGGPVLVIYGIIIVALMSVAVGISLSELASALPSSGGQACIPMTSIPTHNR